MRSVWHNRTANSEGDLKNYTNVKHYHIPSEIELELGNEIETFGQGYKDREKEKTRKRQNKSLISDIFILLLWSIDRMN